MNYDEAKKYSFQVPWKATECFSGPDCWCRIIVPIEPIKYDEYYKNIGTIHKEYDVIVDAGALDQETAEYIVKLHNEHLDRILKQLRKDMNDLNTGLRHPNDSVTITGNPTLEDYRVIYRKEID